MERTLHALLLATTLGLAGGTARADTKEDVAFADALFHQGVILLKQGDDAGACTRFAQSKELAPAVGVSLYLADCLQRIGKPASAWREFRSAEALAIERKDKRATLAHRRADALAAGLDRLTIEVAPSLEGSLRLSLDGKALAKEEWGTAIPVDPGNHVVVARSGEVERVFEAFVDVNRTTASIQIDTLAPDKPGQKSAPAAPPAADDVLVGKADADAAPPEEEKPAGSTGGRLWISLGLAGLGAAGLGIGAGFGVAARSARDQSNDGPCNASDHCTPDGLSLRHQAISDALVSTVAFGVGIAAIGACAIVTFALPHGAGNPVTVSPAPVAGGGGALVQTTF
ncbi:MAG TPA: hypothetical protein VK762_19615 [Polyangiaceae bacterium]|nr:hypothetical protein [Polyangiaceae bacterium]